MTALLVGLFVGGKATRFGGIAKGMLPAPDGGESLAARLVRLCRTALPAADVVLVGRHAAYDALALPSLDDDPPGVGPAGGLAALLDAAALREREALAIAVDLPYVTTSLVERIATHAKGRSAVAPRPSGRWQPLFARYEPRRCLPLLRAALAGGRTPARAVLEALGDEAVVLPLDDAETALLDDWDSPADVTRDRDVTRR
ncbi:MAG TPA: NTP transferase domain-containing protein [Polyangiaceae bacterium]|jgi:molybdopterin-guanine dinucleotide biosynthesis protein A|nr:NTP transferase domain-containing protein [Polyangiaceae bacterium]